MDILIFLCKKERYNQLFTDCTVFYSETMR